MSQNTPLHYLKPRQQTAPRLHIRSRKSDSRVRKFQLVEKKRFAGHQIQPTRRINGQLKGLETFAFGFAVGALALESSNISNFGRDIGSRTDSLKAA